MSSQINLDPSLNYNFPIPSYTAASSCQPQSYPLPPPSQFSSNYTFANPSSTFCNLEPNSSYVIKTLPAASFEHQCHQSRSPAQKCCGIGFCICFSILFFLILAFIIYGAFKSFSF